MAFKFVVFATVLAAANAGLLPSAPLNYAAPIGPLTYSSGPAIAHAAPLAYAAPVAKALVTKELDPDFDPNPQYSYAYDVQDGLTGDNKQHQEIREGDVVHGSYSLVEADGTRRIVDYTADPINGFNAVVHKEPAQVAVKAIAAAPVATYAAAPVAYKAAAPLAYAATPIAYKAPAHYAYVH